MLPRVMWPSGSEVLVGAVTISTRVRVLQGPSEHKSLADVTLLKGKISKQECAERPLLRGVESVLRFTKRFVACRATSVTRFSQSDQPDDLNILVRPIKTSKCVVVR
ncbi:hypothetical protein JOB18_015208 [Solea senegalensis]|uniref:Uncharacterized protein n=1 Tax=Solea senegalensis TaxID=28829 RepID=A0AAV6RW97_SOLSE|nr:hypothetical protein JOB18_015208 [Solea senegalensis]